MISAERLRQVLRYEPETGLFYWRIRLSNRITVGSIAGFVAKDGDYVQIRIDGRLYLAHCLAWLFMTREWPATAVDHRDTDKQNNRWGNLRHATKSQNGANARRSRRNSSGFKGVHYWPKRNKWCAQISVEGRRKTLGLFATADEAHAAYASAAVEAFGEFARAA